MVAETAFIVDSGHPYNTIRFIRHKNNNVTRFYIIWTITWYLATAVGDNEIDDDKKTGGLLAVLIAMAMQRYDTMHIARWSTSGDTLEATGYHHRASACAVSHRRPPWLTILL